MEVNGMYRQKQLWGWILIAFGTGLLTGTWIHSGFLISCLGLGIIAAGVLLLQSGCRFR